MSPPPHRLHPPHLFAAKKPVSPYSGYNGQLLTSVYQPTEMALMHKGLVSAMPRSSDGRPGCPGAAASCPMDGPSTGAAGPGARVWGLRGGCPGPHIPSTAVARCWGGGHPSPSSPRTLRDWGCSRCLCSPPFLFPADRRSLRRDPAPRLHRQPGGRQRQLHAASRGRLRGAGPARRRPAGRQELPGGLMCNTADGRAGTEVQPTAGCKVCPRHSVSHGRAPAGMALPGTPVPLGKPAQGASMAASAGAGSAGLCHSSRRHPSAVPLFP